MYGVVSNYTREFSEADFTGTGAGRWLRLNTPNQGGIVKIVVTTSVTSFTFALFNSKQAFDATGALTADEIHYRVTQDLSGSGGQYVSLAIDPPFYYHNLDAGGGPAGSEGGLYLWLQPSSWAGLTGRITVVTISGV